MFGWQLFINDSVRLAVLTGVGFILVYAFSVLSGQSTLNLLSVAICVVAPIFLGVTVAALFAFYRWVERDVRGLLSWILAAIPLVVMAALVVWMFRQ